MTSKLSRSDLEHRSAEQAEYHNKLLSTRGTKRNQTNAKSSYGTNNYEEEEEEFSLRRKKIDPKFKKQKSKNDEPNIINSETRISERYSARLPSIEVDNFFLSRRKKEFFQKLFKELATFDGVTGDAGAWIREAKLIIEGLGLPFDEALPLLQSKLTGWIRECTSIWIHSFDSLTQFFDALRSAHSFKQREILRNRKQALGESVRDYYSWFKKMENRISDPRKYFSEQEEAEIFFWGLRPEIRVYLVGKEEETSIDKLREAAVKVEKALIAIDN